MNGLAVLGMNRQTGRALSGTDHLRQSINDILTTPLGTRVCNRDYGSALPDLIDAPMNDEGIQSLYAATATAIATWYPFVTLTQIALQSGETSGSVTLDLAGTQASSFADDEPFALSIPLSFSAPLYN